MTIQDGEVDECGSRNNNSIDECGARLAHSNGEHVMSTIINEVIQNSAEDYPPSYQSLPRYQHVNYNTLPRQFEINILKDIRKIRDNINDISLSVKKNNEDYVANSSVLLVVLILIAFLYFILWYNYTLPLILKDRYNTNISSKNDSLQ